MNGRRNAREGWEKVAWKKLQKYWHALPAFNICRLKLPIALELVQELANPMTDERTKLVIFQLLMRVELVDDQGQLLSKEIKAK